MFKHITNFAHKHDIMGAFGFFMFHSILLVGLSTFFGHYLPVIGVMDGGVGSFFDGGSFHSLIGAGWVMILSSMILSGKKLTNDIMSVIIALIGVYFAYTVDVMIGMVVVGYLSTVGK